MFIKRPYDDHIDYQPLHDMLLAYRLATTVTVYPTFWRLRTLLTSRVWQPTQDTQIWYTKTGEVAGFAMLWRRRPDSPYLVLEQILHPVRATASLVEEMLVWALQRVEKIVAEQQKPVALTAYEFALPIDNHLESHGFKLSPTDLEMYNVYFSRSLYDELLSPILPTGYSIRRLGTADDVEAYHALYGFAPVTAVHRRELLASQEYCHLVVADPTGAFVAYCECSIWQAEWVDNKPKIGWIDYVGTKEGSQQRGLGKAVLLAALHQLKIWGAETAQLVTISTNLPANRLYHATGFKETAVSEPAAYEKQIMET